MCTVNLKLTVFKIRFSSLQSLMFPGFGRFRITNQAHPNATIVVNDPIDVSQSSQFGSALELINRYNCNSWSKCCLSQPAGTTFYQELPSLHNCLIFYTYWIRKLYSQYC